MLGTDNIPELPHIRYLFVVREVFRLRRIGAAADVVHLSQPAATQALSRIEALLGVTLFDRRPSGMYPTDAGNFFESRLQRILDHLQLGDRQARRKAGRKEGSGANKSFHVDLR